MKKYTTLLGLCLFVYVSITVFFVWQNHRLHSHYQNLSAITPTLSKEEVEVPPRYSPLLWTHTNYHYSIKEHVSDLEGHMRANMPEVLESEIQLRSEITRFEKLISNLNQAYNAEISHFEITDPLPFDPNNLESTYTAHSDLITEIRLYQELIGNFATKQKSEGKFANPLWTKSSAEIRKIIANMTPEQKAAQLLFFPIENQEMTNDFQEFLTESKPGGMIVMGYNVSSREQTGKFIQDIKNTNDEIPLWIATDQEGGLVARIPWDYTDSPKKWATLSNEQICTLSTQKAQTLGDLGINLNFAPVVDLSYPGSAFINNRTISEDPNVVVQKTQEFVKCSQLNFVSTTLKHYPGHGSTTEDSHITLPTISKSKDEWLTTDAIPYKQIKDAEFVMVGHLVFSSIDAENPATQSPEAVRVLRQDMGYDGVLITDAMGQLHFSTKINVHDALQKVYNSGIDIALYVDTPIPREEIIVTLADMIKSGEVSEANIDTSLERVLKSKQKIIK